MPIFHYGLAIHRQVQEQTMRHNRLTPLAQQTVSREVHTDGSGK